MNTHTLWSLLLVSPSLLSIPEEYVRPLQVRGKSVLVHWWFYPDSYDSVVPHAEVGGAAPEATPSPPSQWWVSSRWLEDTDSFNEWMNEEDYELIPVVRKERGRRRGLALCLYVGREVEVVLEQVCTTLAHPLGLLSRSVTHLYVC